MEALPIECHQQSPLCVVESHINPGVNARADMVQLGYLSYPRFVTPVPIPPHVYTCGYNRQGKMIGTNVTVPYPTKNPPVYKGRDSVKEENTAHSTSNQHNTPGCNPEITTEIDEYFTAENDEGYRKWVQKKLEAEKRKGEIERTPAPPADINNRCKQNMQSVSGSILPKLPDSHYMPTKLISTNQTYGSYLDLKNNYTTERYPRQKGLATEHRIINSSAILPKEQRSHPLDIHNIVLHHVASQKVPYNNIVPRNVLALPSKGELIGVREKGFTFPVYTKTGLELNRPCAAGASLFASMSKQPIHPRRAPVKAINPLSITRRIHYPNQQAVCLPYSTMRPTNCFGNKVAPTTPITYTCMQADGPMLS